MTRFCFPQEGISNFQKFKNCIPLSQKLGFSLAPVSYARAPGNVSSFFLTVFIYQVPVGISQSLFPEKILLSELCCIYYGYINSIVE